MEIEWIEQLRANLAAGHRFDKKARLDRFDAVDADMNPK